VDRTTLKNKLCLVSRSRGSSQIVCQMILLLFLEIKKAQVSLLANH
jgi:hypothetical protein